MTSTTTPRLITPRFALVVSAGFLYFTSLGIMLPAIPLYVEGPLGLGKVAIGIAVGAFAVGAVVLRPWAGVVGDRLGRRVLIIGGASVVALSFALTHLATGIVALVAVRVLGGIGEAAFFVGAGTMITDISAEERRGEALSYWSVAVYGGLAVGPTLGDRIARGPGYATTWTVAALLAAGAALLGVATKESSDRSTAAAPATEGRRRLLHPHALLPGTVLFLGMIGLAGYTSFLALYVPEVGLKDSSGVFALYSVTILAVRIFGARIPDRYGPIAAATVSTTTGAAGLIVIAAVHSTVGLVIGTVVFAFGMSLLYPAMMVLALAEVPASERSSAVGTVSTFFDLSQGVGAAALNGIAALVGYRGGFLAAAGVSIAALVLLRVGSSRAGTTHDDPAGVSSSLRSRRVREG